MPPVASPPAERRAPSLGGVRLWIVDGNNAFGSRPDGWWNNRPAAMKRFTQAVAEWCRTHADEVTVVFDPPVPVSVTELAGGNLAVVESPRRGRNAADHHIVELSEIASVTEPGRAITVVTSDRGLRERLPAAVVICGSGRFCEQIGY